MKIYTAQQAAIKLKIDYMTLLKRIWREHCKPKNKQRFNFKRLGKNWIISEDDIGKLTINTRKRAKKSPQSDNKAR